MKNALPIVLLIFCIDYGHAQWNYYPPKPIYLRQENMFPTNPLMRSVLQLRSDITHPKHVTVETAKLRSDIKPVLMSPNIADLNGYDDDIANVKYVEPHVIQASKLHVNGRIEPMHFPIHPLLMCGERELSHDEFCFNNEPYSSLIFAVCGTNIYKKPTHFCHNGEMHSRLRKGLCGKQLYNKLTQTCTNGNLKSFCGGESYDPNTHFCYQKVYNKERYSLCGKRVYKIKTFFCYKGRLVPKPDINDFSGQKTELNEVSSEGSKYENGMLPPNFVRNNLQANTEDLLKFHLQTQPNTRWFGGKHGGNDANNIFKEVNRIPYNKEESKTGEKKNILPENRKQNGLSGSLRYCGDTKYSEATHFCYRNDIIRRCGNVAYNPEILLCFNQFLYKKEIYDICGHNLFNKFTQACENERVFQRHLYPHELSLTNPNKIKTLENFLLKYRHRLEKSEDKHLLDYSKKLLQERTSINVSKSQCRISRPELEFCYGGNKYSKKLYGICANKFYFRSKYRCLNGRILFPNLKGL